MQGHPRSYLVRYLRRIFPLDGTSVPIRAGSGGRSSRRSPIVEAAGLIAAWTEPTGWSNVAAGSVYGVLPICGPLFLRALSFLLAPHPEDEKNEVIPMAIALPMATLTSIRSIPIHLRLPQRNRDCSGTAARRAPEPNDAASTPYRGASLLSPFVSSTPHTNT
jgi:hypothetical protein